MRSMMKTAAAAWKVDLGSGCACSGGTSWSSELSQLSTLVGRLGGSNGLQLQEPLRGLTGIELLHLTRSGPLVANGGLVSISGTL